MYIPSPPNRALSESLAPPAGEGHWAAAAGPAAEAEQVSFHILAHDRLNITPEFPTGVSRVLSFLSHCFARTTSPSTATGSPGLVKRQATAQSADNTIGVVVGVLLAIFFVGVFAFLYVYRKSIRFTPKRRRRHRKSGSSKSSKASSDGEKASSPPPAPPPAPEAAPAED